MPSPPVSRPVLVFYLLLLLLPNAAIGSEKEESVRNFLETHPEFLLEHPALIENALAAQRTKSTQQEGQLRQQAIADLAIYSGLASAGTVSPGQYRLVFFGFTHCPDICPNTLTHIAQTLTLLRDKASDVQPLLISIDPGRDTPLVLADYVHYFHPAITGLTGTEEQLKRAESAFSVHSEKYKVPEDKDTYTLGHSSWIFLLDNNGEILTRFSQDTVPQKMATSILQFINQENG